MHFITYSAAGVLSGKKGNGKKISGSIDDAGNVCSFWKRAILPAAASMFLICTISQIYF
jgi:hypothetical protein